MQFTCLLTESSKGKWDDGGKGEDGQWKSP